MPPTTRAIAHKRRKTSEQEDSDYGSDFDESDLNDLLEHPVVVTPLVIESIDAVDPLPQVARIPRIPRSSPVLSQGQLAFSKNGHAPQNVAADDDAVAGASRTEIEYETDAADALEARKNERSHEQQPAPSQEELENDPRSPLERFRAQRRRPMSVTDIVSPAWCELQYFYNLAKYGRVQQTPAMRQGSSVHKVLEEEVHVAVPVEVMTREDGFGLRIWNVIQGLRTLRATGMTREFEVWGVVEGQVVNGVIDQLSYTSPDPKFEAALAAKPGRAKKVDVLPVDQPTLQSFLTDSDSPQKTSKTRRVYITDVKTRASNSAPKDQVALRPTYMQLMLYHQLLTQLTDGAVPRERIFDRYHIAADDVFSDIFVAQIAGLDQPSTSSAPDTDTLTEILEHNTCSSLWSLMLTELTIVIPSISPIFCAEYRAASTGDILGTRLFLHDPRRLSTYVADEMAWWTGQRPARGVEIEEAFKCRMCGFAAGCKWRQTKVEEGIQAARAKRAAATGTV